MARGVSLEAAAAMAAALPEVVEGTRYGGATWFVGTKAFAWERPLTKADVKRLAGAAVPEGPLVALATADLAEKEAILAAGTPGVFTIEHFDGYPAVLVRLDDVDEAAFAAALVDAWLAVAPRKLADAHADRLLADR